jgi:hypothetical protein
MSEGRLTTRDIAKAAEHTPAEPAPARPLHEGDRTAMFGPDESSGFRTRWDAIQTGFVDEPRKAVQEADTLVAEVIKRLSEVFADERTTLEHQWERGDQISTEDLRVALKKYRSFFERLLTL